MSIAVAVPCTGANAYQLGGYFMINVPRSGPDYVLDPMNTFLCFQAYISDITYFCILLTVFSHD